MSMYSAADGYIQIPISVDPDQLIQNALLAVAALFPGWVPIEGALDVAILEQAMSAQAETNQVAASAAEAIFAYYGSLVGITPELGSAAEVTTTWVMQDDSGWTVPSGTVVGFQVLGNEFVYFETTEDFTVAAGDTTAEGIVLTAQVAGSAGNGFTPQTMALYTVLSYVTSVTSTAVSSGGSDPETTDAYLDRLSNELQLLAPRPILPADFAAMAVNVAGVYRACAVNLLAPGRTITASLTSASPTLTDLGRSVSDGVLVANSPTVTSETADFTLSDYGRPISGTGIPSNTAIAGIVSSTEVTMSANATEAGTGVAVTLGGSFTLVDVGRSVSGTGIPADTTISAYVSSTEVTMSANATASESSETITLGDLSDVERCVTVGACDDDGNALPLDIEGALQSYLEGKRELNFLVYVIGPTQTEIAVTCGLTADSGYTATAVQTAVQDALTDYLSSGSWAGGSASPPYWDATQTTVRYLSVASVIESVPGVAYVSSLEIGPQGGSMGTSDVDLTGDAPLAAVGTLTVNVTGGGS